MLSQIGQDAWVLHKLAYKRGGTYVEFGAGDGLTNSNTAVLEFEYGWNGILAEPCEGVRAKLAHNRVRNIVKHCCIGNYECDVMFVESEISEISAVDSYVHSDHLADARISTTKPPYKVHCITLMQLLDELGRTNIDYLSIDTEGGEHDILEAFADSGGFEKYNISLITVEHNFTANRDKIFKLLTLCDYRKQLGVNTFWDDWYYKE